MELTEKTPDCVKFHLKVSTELFNCTWTILVTRFCHSMRLLYLYERNIQRDSIKEKSNNCIFPMHNIIKRWKLDFETRVAYPTLKNKSITFFKLVENLVSPGFFSIWVVVLFLLYFLLSKLYHIPSSFTSLKSHLLRSHLLCTSIFRIPRPPMSLGWHGMFHLAN